MHLSIPYLYSIRRSSLLDSVYLCTAFKKVNSSAKSKPQAKRPSWAIRSKDARISFLVLRKSYHVPRDHRETISP